MTPKRRQRLFLIAGMVIGVGIAAGFALKAFNENLMFFYSPTEVVAGDAPADHMIRVGGLVTNGSVKRQPDGLTVKFDLTDNTDTITVQYTGILPDLFREGQGIVAMAACRMTGCLSPMRCWRSMMKTTCRQRSRMP